MTEWIINGKSFNLIPQPDSGELQHFGIAKEEMEELIEALRQNGSYLEIGDAPEKEIKTTIDSCFINPSMDLDLGKGSKEQS